MVHLKRVSRLPQPASDDVSIGWYITLVANILTVIGSALTAKEGG